MNLKHWKYIFIALLVLSFTGFWLSNINKSKFRVGNQIDQLNGVMVYCNGNFGNVLERNVTKDGYNLGLKYQCVEFVKRYYYKRLNHKMPNSYGNAKDFFDKKLKDGQINKQRNLIQYSNSSKTKPNIDDIIVFDKSVFNKYGHVAIISKATDKTIEIIQQNSGFFEHSRKTYNVEYKNNKWKIKNNRVLGWLRKRY